MIPAFLGGLALAALPATANAPAPAVTAAETFAVRAKELHTGYGKVFTNGVLVVENGRVTAVGDKVNIPDGMAVIEHDGALSPGLIAVHDYSGTLGESFDSTRSMLPEAEIFHAYDREHSDLEDVLAAGVTSIVLTPQASALVGGTTCVVRTDGTVLKRRAHMSIGIGGSSLRSNREPTSYSGALRLLREELAEPSGRMAEVTSGTLPVFFHVQERADVLRAISLAKASGFKAALAGAVRFDELAGEVKASGMGVVLGPFGIGTGVHVNRSARELAAADVPFAFALGAPYRHAESLRFGAALSVREGLAPEAALQALTGHAALIAGVADQVGRLDIGTEADFVLWSGHPVDLTSRVESVYLRGVLAHGGEL